MCEFVYSYAQVVVHGSKVLPAGQLCVGAAVQSL